MRDASGLVRPVLYRLGGGDAEAAHERTLRWLERLGRRPRALAAVRRRTARCRPGWSGRSSGSSSPGRSGWPPGWTRTGSRCPPGGRSGSASSRSARSPRTPQPGNPRPRLFRLVEQRGDGQPDGLQQPGLRRPRRPAPRLRRPRLPDRHQPGQVEGHPARGRRRGLRHLAAPGLPVRRLLRGQRQLAEHARVCAPCRTPGRSANCWPPCRPSPSRWPTPSPVAGDRAGAGQAAAGEDRPGPDRRRDRRAAAGLHRPRRGRHHRHQHHDRPRRPRPGRPGHRRGRGRRAVRAARWPTGPASRRSAEAGERCR